jgi:hypothetical protein
VQKILIQTGVVMVGGCCRAILRVRQAPECQPVMGSRRSRPVMCETCCHTPLTLPISWPI